VTQPWHSGQPLIVRFGRFGMARWVLSGVVVEDTGDVVTVWIPPKAPVLELALPDGRLLREIPRLEALKIDTRRIAVMQAGTWFGYGVVMQFPLKEPWSVWWFFHDDGTFDGWYGNLEAPKIRWELADGSRGLDTSDRELDVDIDADGTWRWKDEEAFAAKAGLPGYWTVDQLAEIRADGEALIAKLERREAPFDGRYTDFKPDPAWPMPTLPEHWDHPHSAGP